MVNTSQFETVGIDVSSQTLNVYLRHNHQQGLSREFANDEQGIRQIIQLLKRYNFANSIVMESTGRYHSLCAVMLYENEFKVHVINPLIVKKYQTAHIRKTKTDKIDAKLLAQVAKLEPELPEFKLSREEVALRQKISLIKSLEKSLQKLNASLKNYEQSIQKSGIELTAEENELKKVVKKMQRQKEKLEREFVVIMKEKEGENFQLLQQINGVSDFMVGLILYFYRYEQGNKSGKWVAYTGLDISVLESGLWKGKGKIGKRGNKYLRKRWYSCAWGAVMHNQNFKSYYTRLKQGGRSHVEALNIIARKLIRITYAIMKTKQKFNPEKCF